MTGMAVNGWKLLEMDRNHENWLEMDGNGWTLLDMTENGWQWLEKD